MKRVMALMCLMWVAMSAVAQDKARDAGTKAPVAAEKSAQPVAPKGAQTAGENTKGSTMNAEMSPKGAQTKEPSPKQKAKLAKNRCQQEAKANKLKGAERQQFIKDCVAK